MADPTFVPTAGAVSTLPAYGTTPDGKRSVIGVFTPSDSYPTGGEEVTIGDFAEVQRIEVLDSPGYGLVLAGDPDDPKIKIMAGASEVANTTDLSTSEFIVRVVGV